MKYLVNLNYLRLNLSNNKLGENVGNLMCLSDNLKFL